MESGRRGGRISPEDVLEAVTIEIANDDGCGICAGRNSSRIAERFRAPAQVRKDRQHQREKISESSSAHENSSNLATIPRLPERECPK